MTDQPTALLTAAEVAERLAVPLSWVREQTRQDNIPHLRLGRYARYDMRDIEEWVNLIRAGAGPQFRQHWPSLKLAEERSG